MKIIATLLISIIFISGCASQQTGSEGNKSVPEEQPAPAERQFPVTIGHTFYSPNNFEVNVGNTVRFLAVAARGTGVESSFNHNHGITIDEYSINAAVTSENTPTIVTFVADKAGTFIIYCRTCWDGPFGQQHPDIRATLVVK